MSKFMTEKERQEAIELWERGESTLEDLAARYGKTARALFNLFKKRGIKKGAKAEQVRAEVAAALASATVNEVEQTVKRIADTKEEHYKLASAVRKLVAHSIAKAKQGGHAMATIANDMKALQMAMQTLKIAREEAFVVLGVREEDADKENLPELKVTELTDADIQKNLINRGGKVSIDADIMAIEADLDVVDTTIGEVAAVIEGIETPTPPSGTPSAPV